MGFGVGFLFADPTDGRSRVRIHRHSAVLLVQKGQRVHNRQKFTNVVCLVQSADGTEMPGNCSFATS